MILTTKFSQKTHYETMGVKEDASPQEIRKTYRMAILNCHPDKKLQKTSETSNHEHGSGNEFLEVQRAWETLSDPRSRALYDNELQILGQDSTTADDLRLQDMAVEDAGDCFEFSYHCRCGDCFLVDSLELEEMGYIFLRNGNKIYLRTPGSLPASIVLPCGSCSIKVRLYIDADVTLQMHSFLADLNHNAPSTGKHSTPPFFATRLKDLGADVKLLIKWNSSSHVGHFRNYPVEYRAAVTELLGKAVAIYSQRIRQLEGEKMGLEGTDTEISDPFYNLRKAASRSNQSFERITLDLNNHFVVPGSVEYHEDRGIVSVHDERKEHYIPLSSPPKIGVHGILGQFLFDVCVPKNVENWDIGSSHTLRGEPFTSGWRHSPFNPMKCVRRSRL